MDHLAVMPIATDPEATSRQILEETPERALALLRGVGTNEAIREILQQNGYSSAEHVLGWTLLHGVSGFVETDDGTAAVSGGDKEVRAAIVELDEWDEPGFARIGAALRRLHPEQMAFVFANLEPATGAGAVLSVGTMLDRLDALEEGAERKASRKADHAALATLDKRGITKAERKRLRQLVEKAQGAPLVTAPKQDPKTEKDREKYQEDLRALRAWYVDWSETARAVIHRRDYLIRLGLAKPRRAKKDDGEPKDK